ncbi:MAG: T9SS type A sorting domain-containing protein [Saprospiraceae bacterium]
MRIRHYNHGADPYECSSERYELPLPTVTDNCSSVNLLINVFNAQTGVEQTVEKVENKYYVENLPLKLYKVVITVVDECENVSKCNYYFKAIDDKNPYMACDQHTKVSIGTNEIARLNATSVDDGSFDNCGIATMEIRRMTAGCDSVPPQLWLYVDFCCDEATKTLMVEMKATDINGNSNSCMVEVEVEDKLPPQISCPPNILISCDYFYDPDNLNKYFGKVVTDEVEIEDIIINDYYNEGYVGQDGYSYDNCNVTVTSTSTFNLNNCNVGTITRKFTTTDNGGRTAFCTQTITIQNPTPFNEYGTDIIWPADTTFYGCSNLQADTSLTGAPIVNDNMCSMVAMTYEDQLFPVQSGACEKIIRTWTVRDWCQTNDNYWTYEQYIMLINTTAPTFTSNCDDRDVCVYGECEGLVELSASAVDDCTDQEDLDWVWKLDVDRNGTYDLFGQGNNFSKTMTEGTYTISWIVEDKCGNKNVCTYDFTVKDCKKPTPLCITDLTTVVMNQAGMVSITADAFDHGSYDNCTPSNYGTCGCLSDLKYSFSQDVNDTVITYTCDSIDNGVSQTFYLNMWVTDLAGNQDYCSVQLQVQDNNDVCPDNGNLSAGGLITRWSDNETVEGFPMLMQSNNSEFYQAFNSLNNGSYKFSNVPAGYNYSIEGQDNVATCASGVTTADIVKVQKHILGISKFNSPYQYIAADVNKSQSVSASDIADIRKLILGINTQFPKNKCWELSDASITLNVNDPFSYSNTLDYTNLNSTVTNANFKVIKIGDINDNHDLNTSGLEFRDAKNAIITLNNTLMTENEEIEIPVYINDIEGFEGIQFTIKFNNQNLVFKGYSESRIDPVENNFGFTKLDDGYITFSWNSMKTISLNNETPLFYLKFKTLTNSYLGDNITINSDITPALAVINNDESPVGFRVSETENIVDKMVVYQNNPNPFTDETTISFTIPTEENVNIKITDITGKVLFEKTNKYQSGFNQFRISSSELSAKGVLFYTLKANDELITKKMVVIE